jgi:hypothetical protein
MNVLRAAFFLISLGLWAPAAVAQSPREDFGFAEFPRDYGERSLGAAPPSTLVFAPSDARSWGGVFGIDVSHHSCGDSSATLLLDTLDKYFVRYVYMKAFNGAYPWRSAFKDEKWEDFWKQVAKHKTGGMQRTHPGIYHWLTPFQSGVEQADALWKEVGNAYDSEPLSMPIAVDIEPEENFYVTDEMFERYKTDKFAKCKSLTWTKPEANRHVLSNATSYIDMKFATGDAVYACKEGWAFVPAEGRAKIVSDFLTRIDALTKRNAVIYTGAEWWKKSGVLPDTSRKALEASREFWWARYTDAYDTYANEPWRMLPTTKPYPKIGGRYTSGTHWQFTQGSDDSGQVTFKFSEPIMKCSDGSSRDVSDANWFPSDYCDFRQFAVGPNKVPPKIAECTGKK